MDSNLEKLMNNNLVSVRSHSPYSNSMNGHFSEMGMRPLCEGIEGKVRHLLFFWNMAKTIPCVAAAIFPD